MAPGTLDSVRDPEHAIRTYIDGWTSAATRFIWTKDTDATRQDQPSSYLGYRGTWASRARLTGAACVGPRGW